MRSCDWTGTVGVWGNGKAPGWVKACPQGPGMDWSPGCRCRSLHDQWGWGWKVCVCTDHCCPSMSPVWSRCHRSSWPLEGDKDMNFIRFSAAFVNIWKLFYICKSLRFHLKPPKTKETVWNECFSTCCAKPSQRGPQSGTKGGWGRLAEAQRGRSWSRLGRALWE